MSINKLIHLKLPFCQKLLCFPSEVGCRLSGPEVRLNRMMIMFLLRGPTRETGDSGLLRPCASRHAGQKPLSCWQGISMEDGRPPSPSFRLQHRPSPSLWRGAAGRSASRVREGSIWVTPVGSPLCSLGCRRGSPNPRMAEKCHILHIQSCDERWTPAAAGAAHVTGETGPAPQQSRRLLLAASTPDVQLRLSSGHGAGRWWGSVPWSGAGSPHVKWPDGQHPAGPQRKLPGLPALAEAAHLLAADHVSSSRIQHDPRLWLNNEDEEPVWNAADFLRFVWKVLLLWCNVLLSLSRCTINDDDDDDDKQHLAAYQQSV